MTSTTFWIYGLEKFSLADDGAATSGDSLQVRLAKAYIDHLIHVGQENVPEEVWTRLQKLRDALATQNPSSGGGSVKVSTSAMNDHEARKWLQEIVSMFTTVAMEYGAHRDNP